VEEALVVVVPNVVEELAAKFNVVAALVVVTPNVVAELAATFEVAAEWAEMVAATEVELEEPAAEDDDATVGMVYEIPRGVDGDPAGQVL